MNQKGLSFIEVLVAIALSVGLALLAAQTIAYQKKAQKQMALVQLKREIAEEIQSDVGVYTLCSKMLQKALPTSQILPPAYDGTIDPQFFDKRIRHPELEISTAKLTYKQDTGSDIQKYGSSKVYQGKIALTARSRYAQPGQFMDLRDIEVPLTIFDQNGAGAWADISCTNPVSQLTSIVSEACAYYGGILTNGLHCDFSRVFRNHYGNLPESQVPMQNDPSKIRLMQLPIIMCYLDTLITMIPDHDLSTRDPAQDRYRKPRTTTKFCKRPGVVYGSEISPVPVKMNEVLKTMSPDVRPFFTEEGAYGP